MKTETAQTVDAIIVALLWIHPIALVIWIAN